MAQHKRTSTTARSRRTRLAAATAVTAALTGGLLAVTGATASAAPAEPLPSHEADFNGDGVADLATSAAYANVGGKDQAGQVVVTYGGSTLRHKTFSQNSAGVPGSAEAGDVFGYDTAYGDFDRDGYDDLAIAAPGEDVGSDKDGGTAQILWGSPNGLSGGTTVKDPRPSGHDFFGGPIEAGDFDGDGNTDLAIGARSGAATIDVVNGKISRTGGTGSGHYTVKPAIQSGEGAGPFNLHAGDVNGDKREDLIVDGYSTGDSYNANLWVPGTADGLKTTNQQRLPGGIITDVGDTDSDGYGDIVIGLEWDDEIAGANKGGSVYVVHGSATGPYGGTQVFTQDSAGVPGAGEKGDSFGNELDLGDINGDGHLDLVVGAAGEDLAGVTDAGSVTVIYGKADGSGLSTDGAVFLDQNTPGVPNSNEKGDFFGADVHVDDLNGDGRGDVTVGAYGENGANGALYPLISGSDGTLTGATGVYTSTVGVSATGTPRLGMHFAD
ncbi:VCBS repeat-containing protein [Streptomyces sp. Je 1-369]|uniref:VCBS repeat-containing protein n=1 Tax=Streptomyces sp. Je 1-369 TaxID=2966192 RepID=UPI002286208B|nr:VCBS repeat-containing protein [Streptomyces sp. Je 1-369]WAL96762.1 FG-GAP and VCBS repeat-containing protein [Streptomyces sp. Je 1-369]